MNVERNAEWLKKQRSSMLKAINEVINVVATEVLKPNNEPRYHLEFSLGIAGRVIELRVYDNVADKQIDKSEIWNLDTVLDEGWIRFEKEHIQKRVRICLKELRSMKVMAVKYATLNDKSKS